MAPGVQGSGCLGDVLGTKRKEQDSCQPGSGRMEVPVAEMEKGVGKIGELRR